MSSKSFQADVRVETLAIQHNVQDDEGVQDEQSVMSLHTSDAESLYTVIDGRTFTSQSDTYMLPADAEEHRRLTLQHTILRILLGGLFAFKDLVESLLREGQVEPPHVLDIGTGSGQWPLDMASTYPWAKVVGTDLVPPALISQDKIPSNCRFEIDDANLPMEHYADMISIVHARAVSRGLNDVNSFFYQVARTLKPGGVFLMIHGDLRMRDENLVPFPFVEPGEPGFTWMQYVCGQVQSAWQKRGGSTHKPRWRGWLESNPNYCEVRQRELNIPIGAWKEGITDQESIAASMMKENMSNVLESWRRLLLGDGHSAKDVNHWVEECRNEMKDMRVHSYLRFVYFAAVRSDTPWQERGDWTLPDA